MLLWDCSLPSLNAAFAASSPGDTIIATEGFEDTTDMQTHYTTENILIDVADNARGDKNSYTANGYRRTGQSLLLTVKEVIDTINDFDHDGG